jgi:hypothetical protein
MKRPDYVYRFKRHRTDGQGTRFDLASWEGPGTYAPLVCPLKRTGEAVVYVNRWRVKTGTAPDPRKGGLILAAPGRAKGEGGRNITSIFEPLPERPGQGFGDVDRLDALLTRRDEEAGTLTIFVFLKAGLQAQYLFTDWIDGQVAEEIDGTPRTAMLDNNVSLDADSATVPPS